MNRPHIWIKNRIFVCVNRGIRSFKEIVSLIALKRAIEVRMESVFVMLDFYSMDLTSANLSALNTVDTSYNWDNVSALKITNWNNKNAKNAFPIKLTIN